MTETAGASKAPAAFGPPLGWRRQRITKARRKAIVDFRQLSQRNGDYGQTVDVTTHPAFAGPSSPDSTAGVPHPFVTQDGEQPSPGARLPSSHASYAGASTPSPQ